MEKIQLICKPGHEQMQILYFQIINFKCLTSALDGTVPTVNCYNNYD